MCSVARPVCVCGKQKYSTLMKGLTQQMEAESADNWLTGPRGIPPCTKLTHQRLCLQLVTDRSGDRKARLFWSKAEQHLWAIFVLELLTGLDETVGPASQFH